jgi:hypothetical protein
MQKIIEVLRLKHEARLSHEKIARACGLSKAPVVRVYVFDGRPPSGHHDPLHRLLGSFRCGLSRRCGDKTLHLLAKKKRPSAKR